LEWLSILLTEENCKEEIVDQFDHATVLMKLLSCRISTRIKNRGHHVILVDYQPTSENMVIDFAQRIIARLPADIKLLL
jgi:6-pyruvoyltetrahydropterin/6-carboxytetrahydropterin synthase